jgi:RNA polymerase sigma-70 factor (ECF subfamily)
VLIEDETTFAGLVARHRGELRVHCYRMLGSFDEAEDLVQETVLRAWKGLAGFDGRAELRTWLYRIATNACLDALERRSRRLLPQDLAGPFDPRTSAAPRLDLPWLQPFPDASSPDEQVVARETLELAFLAAIQHLPPRQRAALILRDVLGWPAADTADLLASSVASVNSSLQRARATMRERLPRHRQDWTAVSPTTEERAVLRRYMDALARADLDAVANLLAEDVRAAMPPYPNWYSGRDAVLATLATSWDPDSPAYVGRFRAVPTRANGGPALATYLRGPGERVYAACAIVVPRVEGDRIAELVAFHDPGLFPAFGLSSQLPN